MKRVFFILSSVLLSLFVMVGLVFAQDKGNQGTSILPRGTTINSDYFASGGSVILSGTVNGDAYLAGGSVLVDGEVNGDLLVAGGNVNIQGPVRGNIRVIGGQTVVSSEVGGNISVAGGSANITDRATVRGSLVSATGSLEVLGPVGKGANINGGQVTLGNSIGGDINSMVGRLVLLPSARVNGNLNYTSNTPVEIQSGAQVAGRTTQNIPPQKPAQTAGAAIAAGIVFKVISFISYLIIGLILLWLVPNLLWGKVRALVDRPLLSLGIGFLTLIVTPVVIFVLFITVLGIPIALILLAIFFITLYLSVLVASFALGWKVFDLLGQKRIGGWALAVGLLIYEIITLIPVVGGIVTFLALLFGLGAIILFWNTFYHALRSKNTV